MIVVCASLKKSGSGWLFNMTNDLLVQAGHQDVRALRRDYGLEAVLLEDNCRVNPNGVNLARLLPAHLQGNTFAVKTHAGPTPSLRLLMALGIAKTTYIYRDPRDVVLSALDHGKRVRNAGQANVLAALQNVEDAVHYVRPLLDDWEAWTRTRQALMIRYEDLVDDAGGVLDLLAGFLQLDVSEADRRAVVARYASKNQNTVVQQRTHFNKGVTERFRSQMSPEELALCQNQFGPYLQRMGYAT